MKVSFTVHGPPVPCARPRVGKNGHAFMPTKTKNYEKHVAACALNALMKSAWRVDWGSYGVVITVHREARRGDLDNYTKSILDGLTKAHVWDDDAQVEFISAVMCVDRMLPRVVVEIEMLGDHSLEERRAAEKREQARRRGRA